MSSCREYFDLIPEELSEALCDEAAAMEALVGQPQDPWSLQVCVNGVRDTEPGGTHDCSDPMYTLAIEHHRNDPVSDVDLSFWYHSSTNERIETVIDGRSALSEVIAHLRSEPVCRQLSKDFNLELAATTSLSLNLTRFGPGSFLSPHTDLDDAETLALAVVIFLNQSWHPYLGGSLVVSSSGEWQSFLPLLGRIVCFRPSIENTHFVEQVHLAAPTPRYAISGWYHR